MLKLFLKDNRFMIQTILGLTIGIVLGNIISTFKISSELTAIFIIVSINSIISSFKYMLESQFDDRTVFISFNINLFASLLFLYLGNYIGLSLYYLVLFALVLDVFKNLSIIHKYLIKNYKKL